MKTEFLEPSSGPSVWVVGDLYTMKTTGRETGGAFALVEALIPPGGGPPPHVHSREDEAFYVLDGTLEFHADGQTFNAGPGAWVSLAKGSKHFFRNMSTRPARALIMVTPAGLEEFFQEIGRAPGDGVDPRPTPEDVERLLAAAPSYGLEILKPAD